MENSATKKAKLEDLAISNINNGYFDSAINNLLTLEGLSDGKITTVNDVINRLKN